MQTTKNDWKRNRLSEYEIEAKISNKESWGSDGFIGEFYQILK